MQRHPNGEGIEQKGHWKEAWNELRQTDELKAEEPDGIDLAIVKSLVGILMKRIIQLPNALLVEG